MTNETEIYDAMGCGNFRCCWFSPLLHSELLYSHPSLTCYGVSVGLCKHLD